MYKVFINDKPIILTDSLQNQNELPFFIYKDVVLDEVIHKLEVDLLASAYLYTLNLEESWEDFRTYFKVVVAGGGLVLNENKEVLFIFRGGKWDLPKGRIEEGELIEETAVREVEEECGISNLRLDRFLLKTHHVFYQGKVRKLKETYWYLMHSDEEQELVPQEEEGITIAEFKTRKEASEALKNSYANIQLVINHLDI